MKFRGISLALRTELALSEMTCIDWSCWMAKVYSRDVPLRYIVAETSCT